MIPGSVLRARAPNLARRVFLPALGVAILGIALFGLGVWRLMGGTGSPVVPGVAGMILAGAAVGAGFWLYRSSCGT